MQRYDPNPDPRDAPGVALFAQDLSVHEWFARWVGGTLAPPTLVQDPDTLQWRGATDAEVAQMLDEAGYDDE